MTGLFCGQTHAEQSTEAAHTKMPTSSAPLTSRPPTLGRDRPSAHRAGAHGQVTRT